MKNYVIRTYGRTRAHALSATQQNNLKTLYQVYGITLPEFEVDPRSLFSYKINVLSFEIGFGNGEHLIEMAKRNPNVGFFGCEPFENGVAATLDAIQRNKLENVRIYNGDARKLLNKFPNRSLDRVYILFPDPWRKKRHHKRRLISEEFLGLIKMKMKPYRYTIIATDHENYLVDILTHLRNIHAIFNETTIFERPACFFGTKYERKAIARGSTCAYVRAYL